MNNPTTSDDEWDAVDEAGIESFPASDPPGWGSSHASTAAPIPPVLRGSGRHLVEEEPAGPRYLVAYTGRSARVRRLATTIDNRLRELGQVTELADLAYGGVHLADYDAAIIGLAVGVWLDPVILRWIHHARPQLDETPTALLVVGHHARIPGALVHVQRIGWRPTLIATFPRGGVREWFARISHDAPDATRLATRFAAIVSQLEAPTERAMQ